jgi:hypothetical protein
MPHLDSDTIRPLYDVHDGGPPKGFECKICLRQPAKFYGRAHGRVTRTLAGMRTHQRIVHGIKQQEEFNFSGIQGNLEAERNR